MSALPRMKAPRWLRDIVGPYRKNAAAAIALGIATLACASLLMFASGYLISKTALPTTTLFMVMVPVALVQLFGIGRPVLRYFERLVSHDWVFRVTSSLRRALFESVESQAGKPGAMRSTGKYLELLSEDIGHLQNLYLRVAFPTVIGIALFALATVFAGFFSWQAALTVLVCGLIAAVLVPASMLLVTTPMRRKAKEARSFEYARITDDILGAADWALAGRCGEAAANHEAAGRDVLEADAAIRRATRIADLCTRIALGCGLVALVLAAACALQGDAESANYIAAFALGFFPVIETLALLPSALSDFPNHGDSITRLDEVLEGPPASQPEEILRLRGYAAPLRMTEGDASHPARDDMADVSFRAQRGISGSARPAQDDVADASFRAQRGISGSARSAQEGGLAIELSEVSYAYPNARANTISSLSLLIQPGQKVAVLGASGAGKTTLGALIRGEIEPTSGTVALVDGDGLRTAVQGSGSVSYIPQSAFVFDQTLRENLAMARPGATDDELVAALSEVGLAGKLASMPDGLSTRIGETGTGFSGGEAHRLALARALLMDKPIVLLDEPFSALDPETERILLDKLLEAFAGKTLIVITHHLAEIERFDRVVFIEGGTVSLSGKPAELMRENAWFNRLVSFDRGLSQESS